MTVAADPAPSSRIAIERGAVAAIEGNATRVATDEVGSGVRAHREDPPQGIGGTFLYGPSALRGGPRGHVFRYDHEMYPVFPQHGDAGGTFGIQVGYEYSRAGADNWGFAVPVTWMFGFRAQPVRAAIGFGLNLVAVDQVNDDTGVGLFSPFGVARLGADVDGFQIGIDGRVGYHWQFGAEDRSRWQVGAFIGKTWEPKPGRPLY